MEDYWRFLIESGRKSRTYLRARPDPWDGRIRIGFAAWTYCGIIAAFGRSLWNCKLGKHNMRGVLVVFCMILAAKVFISAKNDSSISKEGSTLDRQMKSIRDKFPWVQSSGGDAERRPCGVLHTEGHQWRISHHGGNHDPPHCYRVFTSAGDFQQRASEGMEESSGFRISTKVFATKATCMMEKARKNKNKYEDTVCDSSTRDEKKLKRTRTERKGVIIETTDNDDEGKGKAKTKRNVASVVIAGPKSQKTKYKEVDKGRHSTGKAAGGSLAAGN